MAFDDDLLQQAFQLAHNEPRKPRQASLRRAISAAYYALFHLLISEATGNWKKQNLRFAVGRVFEHATMKSASNRVLNPNLFPFTGENADVVSRLRLVAGCFVRLQDTRQLADYDNYRTWTRTGALSEVRTSSLAFEVWKSIRNEEIAQAYLVSLFVKHRG